MWGGQCRRSPRGGGRQEALSATVPPLSVPAPPTRRSSPAAQRSGLGPHSAGGSGAPAAPFRYLRARRRGPRITRRQRLSPPTVPRALARGDDVRRRAVRSEGHGGGGGTLAGCGSAEEKALCRAASAREGGTGAGPGGRAPGGLRSRASSHPGGWVSAGSALGPSLSLGICKVGGTANPSGYCADLREVRSLLQTGS